MSDETPQSSVGLPEAAKPDDARLRTRGVLIALLTIVAVVLAIGGVVLATNGDDEPNVGDAAAAPCAEVITRPTDRTQEHVVDEDISYADAPPSFGKHFAQWAPFERAFYTDDRPPVSFLVHNLEHGYTIAWYDEVAAGNEATMGALETLADSYLADHERFLVVPWRPADGGDFPEGMHVAVTRWTADAANPADLTKQRGNWLYCGGADEDAIRAFFEEFPNTESPEPGIPAQ